MVHEREHGAGGRRAVGDGCEEVAREGDHLRIQSQEDEERAHVAPEHPYDRPHAGAEERPCSRVPDAVLRALLSHGERGPDLHRAHQPEDERVVQKHERRRRCPRRRCAAGPRPPTSFVSTSPSRVSLSIPAAIGQASAASSRIVASARSSRISLEVARPRRRELPQCSAPRVPRERPNVFNLRMRARPSSPLEPLSPALSPGVPGTRRRRLADLRAAPREPPHAPARALVRATATHVFGGASEITIGTMANVAGDLPWFRSRRGR